MKKYVINENKEGQHRFAVSVTEACEVVNRLLQQWNETGLTPIESTSEIEALFNDAQKFICERANPDLCKVLKVPDMFKMLNINGIDQVVQTVQDWRHLERWLPYITLKKGQATPNEARIKEAQQKMIRYAENEAEIELHEATQAAKAAIETLKKYITNKDELLRALGLMPPYRSY
jgi:hypothetical protein